MNACNTLWYGSRISVFLFLLSVIIEKGWHVFQTSQIQFFFKTEMRAYRLPTVQWELRALKHIVIPDIARFFVCIKRLCKCVQMYLLLCTGSPKAKWTTNPYWLMYFPNFFALVRPLRWRSCQIKLQYIPYLYRSGFDNTTPVILDCKKLRYWSIAGSSYTMEHSTWKLCSRWKMFWNAEKKNIMELHSK